MSSDIDWTALVKDKKGVLTLDNRVCGEIIGEREGSIIVQDGGHFYKIPKDKVIGYNGSEVTLRLKPVDLKAYEQEKTDEGNLSSIADNK